MKSLYTTLMAGALLTQSATAQLATAPGHIAPVRFHQDAHGAPTLRGGGPANDDCANAEVLTVNAECVNTAGDNSAATHDGADPACDETTDTFKDVWYTFNSGSNTQVLITLTPGTIEDIGMELLDGGCGGTSLACDFSSTSYSWDVTANTDYTVRIWSNTQFGEGGTFDVCITVGVEPPANDLCEGAVAQNLAVGSTLTFSGTTVGATDSEGFGFASTFESFTTTECANITIDYCGMDPVYGGWTTGLGEDCPLSSVIPFTDTSRCGDGNFIVTYEQVPAGTYWFAQAAIAGFADPGPYTANVSATSCIIGMDEFTAADWSLFPNPGAGVFNLRYSGKNGLANIEVMDVTGRVVYNEQAQLAKGTTASLDLTGLSVGNYSVRLTVDGVRTEQRLMVK